MWSFREWIAWLLLLAFGVPSLGGSGLHQFLPHHAHDAESDEVIAGDGLDAPPFVPSCSLDLSLPEKEFAPDGVLIAVHDQHDAETCFLCHFLIQPGSGLSSGWTLPPAPAAILTNVSPLLFSLDKAFLHAGRSPPAFERS